MNRPLMATSYTQSENALAMHSVYSRLQDWRFPNVRFYILQTQVMNPMVWWRKKLNRWLQKITGLMHTHGASKIVIACNSSSAVYSDTDEIRGIAPFGVSSVLKSNGPQKLWLLKTVQFVAGFPENSLFNTDSRSGNASHNHFRFK